MIFLSVADYPSLPPPWTLLLVVQILAGDLLVVPPPRPKDVHPALDFWLTLVVLQKLQEFSQPSVDVLQAWEGVVSCPNEKTEPSLRQFQDFFPSWLLCSWHFPSRPPSLLPICHKLWASQYQCWWPLWLRSFLFSLLSIDLDKGWSLCPSPAHPIWTMPKS